MGQLLFGVWLVKSVEWVILPKEHFRKLFDRNICYFKITSVHVLHPWGTPNLIKRYREIILLASLVLKMM